VSEPTPPNDKTSAPPQAIAGAALGVTLFALVALGLVGLAGYYAIVRHVEVTQPRVWVALVGALYFGWRAAMMFMKYKGGRGARR
jgi:Na+/H+-translocating membrane pyrophosphatase